jgi:hypothetical protein
MSLLLLFAGASLQAPIPDTPATADVIVRMGADDVVVRMWPDDAVVLIAPDDEQVRL